MANGPIFSFDPRTSEEYISSNTQAFRSYQRVRAKRESIGYRLRKLREKEASEASAATRARYLELPYAKEWELLKRPVDVKVVLPLWIWNLIPQHSQLRRHILIAALRRGISLHERIAAGSVTIYSIRSAQQLNLTISTASATKLEAFRKRMYLRSPSAAVRTAIVAGFSLRAAMKGDPSPSRVHPLETREWMTLLLTQGVPLPPKLSRREAVNEEYRDLFLELAMKNEVHYAAC